MNFATNGECGAFNGGGTTDTARYGKDPLVLDRGGESHRARHRAVRTHGDGHLPAGAGLLRGVWRQPDQRLGQASLRVADRDWRAARDPAAALGRGHLQPPPLSKPDRRPTSWVLAATGISGARISDSASGGDAELLEPDVRLLHRQGADGSASAERRRLHRYRKRRPASGGAAGLPQRDDADRRATP